MSDQTATSIQPIERSEHRDVNGVQVKAVAPYALDTVSGNLTAMSAGMIPAPYDYVAYTATSGIIDTYQFYSGGSGGTLVATITIQYTGTDKSQISSVGRT
jgi:cellobiose-specific phosphotransferase system component IIC